MSGFKQPKISILSDSNSALLKHKTWAIQVTGVVRNSPERQLTTQCQEWKTVYREVGTIGKLETHDLRIWSGRQAGQGTDKAGRSESGRVRTKQTGGRKALESLAWYSVILETWKVAVVILPPLDWWPSGPWTSPQILAPTSWTPVTAVMGGEPYLLAHPVDRRGSIGGPTAVGSGCIAGHRA